jgi:hypothetical protein
MIEVIEKFEGLWRVMWGGMPLSMSTTAALLSIAFTESIADEVGFSSDYGQASSTTWITRTDGMAWLQDAGWAEHGNIKNLYFGKIKCYVFRSEKEAIQLADTLEKQIMWKQLMKKV